MKSETIRQTMRTWEAEPEKARVKPAVKARSEGAQAVLEAGSFSWRADLPPSLGGTNQAPSPTALLLSAPAGCAVVFIRDTLAPQLGIPVEAVEAEARCEADFRGLLDMAGVAPDLDKVQITIQVQSSAGRDEVEKIIDAWRERCPIYLALTKPMEVTLSAGTVEVPGA